MSFVSRGLSAVSLIAVAIVAMLAPAPSGSSTGAFGIQSVAATAPPVNPIYNSTIPSPAVSGHAGLYAWGAATLNDGTVIIGDIWNHRVVHFDTNGNNLGVLFTMTGGPAPYGLAVDLRNNTIYVGINQCCEVQKWSLVSGVYVQQPSLVNKHSFKYPSRVAVASDGTVYVVDMLANAVFVYDSTGHLLFQFGIHGTGDGQFKQPRGAAFDGSNPQRLYIMDSFNFRVQVFDRAGNFLFKFGSKGTGPGQFISDNTRGLAIDKNNGWIYVVDDDNNLVQKYDLNGVFIQNIAGTGGRSATVCCSTPAGLFSDGGREDTVDGNGNLWVGDMPNFRAQVFSPTGQSLLVVSTPPQLPPVGAFNYPEGVAVDSLGNVIVDDSRNFRIQKFTPTAGFLWQVGLRGRFSGYAFNYAQNIVADPSDNSIIVADDYNNVIKKFDRNGVFLWKVGIAACGSLVAQFCHPVGVAVGPDSRIYVADTHNQRIVQLGADGSWVSSFTDASIKDPRGIAVDTNGDLYVANFINANIVVFNNSGTYLRTISQKGTTDSTFQHPWDVVVDANYVYATDNSLNQVKVFNKLDGSFVVAFGGSGRGPGQLRGPEGLALGPGGIVYVADTFNDRVQSWCVTCAGPQTPTYVRTIGSNGQAQVYPSGLDVDAAGNVFVADTGNDQVKMYAAGASTPTWTAGARGTPIGGGTDSFQKPRDVAVDSNFVYVADTEDQMVQVLNKSDGSYVQSWSFKFSSPYGISVGSDGQGHERVFVADGGNGNTEVFDAAGTHLLTVPPTTSNAATRDAATDSLGNIYTADYRNDRIDKYSPSGTLLLQWGGPVAPTCQQVPKPFGIAIDSADHIYVASSNSMVIKEFNPDASCVATFGTKGTGAQQLYQLRRVAVGRGANPLVYAADLWGLKVLVYNQDGSISGSQPQLGNGTFPPVGGLNEAHGVAVSSSFVYVTDTVNQRMQRFNLNGTSPIAWSKGTPESVTGFNWAEGVGINPMSGNVWVADTRNNRIDEFGPDGSGPLRSLVTGTGGVSLNQPMSVSFDGAGNMYIADTFNNQIESYAVPASGTPTFRWAVGTGGTGVGNFSHPWDVIYDGSQVSPRLLIADTNNSRVVALDPANGTWLSVLNMTKGSEFGQVLTPKGLAVSPTGTIWVADTGNDRIEMFNPNGNFANELVGGFGTANDQFNEPQGIEIGPDGLLYVGDASNNRVQVFQP